MPRVNAYVRRNGDCREMMEFYRECLGGNLALTLIKETPVAKDFPEVMQNKVMHANLTSGDLTLLGSDLPDPAGHNPGNDWALEIDCANEPELTKLFERLSKGGTVHSPPGPAFWGGVFAMLSDQFGVDWMLNYQPEQRQS
jgi:PhnB protein